jgi:hypothetical protein
MSDITTTPESPEAPVLAVPHRAWYRRPTALVTTAALAIGVALALTACGGSSTVTLHGTFTDSADTSSGSACADQGTLSGAGLAVTVDNVAAGTAPVTWSGNPADLGTTLGGDTVYGCKSTWSVTVPAAHDGYQVSVTGLGGVTGSVTIPVADAGKPNALDDNISNDQGGAALEVSS